jgi:hypothetical protein
VTWTRSTASSAIAILLLWVALRWLVRAQKGAAGRRAHASSSNSGW